MDRKEAIEKARELLACGALSQEACDAIKRDFPELVESEDKKLLGKVLGCITYVADHDLLNGDVSETRLKAWLLSHLVLLEKQKEQKPILEVFGFKVGDAVRLKDGDGRKHIIKSFEKIEGLHGPDFYHVEFEDNSARDGIYPGEEYPNGYYTQMEKFEEEQKPAEWSSLDKACHKVIQDTIRGKFVPAGALQQATDWFDSLPERVSLTPKHEWSDDDEKMLVSILWHVSNSVTNRKQSDCRCDLTDWLKALPERIKSLRPQHNLRWRRANAGTNLPESIIIPDGEEPRFGKCAVKDSYYIPVEELKNLPKDES